MIDGLHRQLSERLKREIVERQDSFAAASDWPDFKYRAGYVQAFKDILGFCKELEQQIYGKDADRAA